MPKKEKKLEIVQKYYIRKKNGEIDYKHPYDSIVEPKDKEGLYYVCSNGLIGYMDEDGKFVIPLSYDFTRTNFKGFTHYHQPDWYFFDNQTLITPVYKNNHVGAINNRGEEIVPCEFEDVKVFGNYASENFIPVALPSEDNLKLVFGMYDVKNKQISVTPQYEDISKEENGYASFLKNGLWGLLHCASGTVVIPAIYMLKIQVSDTGIGTAFLGGKYTLTQGVRGVIDPDDCHVFVVNGENPAQIVVSGYNWIEHSGHSVMKCRIGKSFDSFKILKMPEYIAIIKNATYAAGYILEKKGKFIKEWTPECTTTSKLDHAKYISGGIFTAVSYSGENIPVTDQMRLEILRNTLKE